MDDNRDNIGGNTDIIHNYSGLWTVSDYSSTPGFNSGIFGKIISRNK